MTELTSLKNIGKEYDRKLKAIGITTAEELKQIGCEEAFIRLKNHFPNVCLVHLQALEGAITGVDYNKLSEDVKQRLKAFNEGIS